MLGQRPACTTMPCRSAPFRGCHAGRAFSDACSAAWSASLSPVRFLQAATSILPVDGCSIASKTVQIGPHPWGWTEWGTM